MTALEPCETVVLHRAQCDHLRLSDPSLDRQLVACLAAQVEALSERRLEVLFLPTRLRVVHTLLALAREYGPVVTMTQRDIGLMAGTSRPTVNETVRELERTGAVRVGRGRLDILDPPGLARRLGRTGR